MLDADTQRQTWLKGPDTHLQHMLGWLHQLLAWQIDVTRHTFGTLANDPYRGLCITDGEIDVLAANSMLESHALTETRIALAQQRSIIDVEHGEDSRLYRVATLFDLSPFEQDVLLLALASELDLRYERIFGYVQDDVTKKRPTVDLAVRLLCVEPTNYLAIRTAFKPEAPLLRHSLIQLFTEGHKQASLLSYSIKIDTRIVAELIGQSGIDATIAAFVTLTHPNRSFDQLAFPSDLRAQLRQAVQHHANGLCLVLHGGYGSGRKVVAEALCTDLQLLLVSVDLDRMLESHLEPDDAIQRIIREATLHQSALLLYSGDRLLHDERATNWRLALLAALDNFNGLVFCALEQPWEARGMLQKTRFLRIELPTLSYAEREQIWYQRLCHDEIDETAILALSSTFRLTGGQIRDAVAMARSLTGWRNGRQTQQIVPAVQDLYAACRAQSSGLMDSLAQKITTHYTWNDIVLPSDQMAQLREICSQVRHRRTVLEEWGFDHQLAMGKGVNVLFAGQSGTGKTMAAEIIASDLGQELYKIDLSSLVSKYIGETEKNLDRIFKAAREANAILFFDEADAIFGKRSEVKDAQDRYANIEVGYLLQKMEECDGVVILATNLRKNMDDAFVRRLHVAIEFPFPEESDRTRIWNKVFPTQAPQSDDVDLAFMARQFKLAGGNIRNIALLSAFLAAEDGSIIHMVHLIRATKREYQKIGKLVTGADFGPYLLLLKREYNQEAL